MAETRLFTYDLDGLDFTITVVEENGVFSATIRVTEGAADFNALYWGDDVKDGSTVTLGDKALNLNGASFEGETIDWDGAVKLSSAGLGPAGTDKPTYLVAGESATFTLSGVTSMDQLDFMGVRATSTSTPAGSIKAIDDAEIILPPEDNFPEWTQPEVSHVTFYFDVPDGFEFDLKGDGGPDGWFTVKFDVTGDQTMLNDLDNWDDAALAKVYAEFGDISQYLVGAAIKGGRMEGWYDYDGDATDVDTPPPVYPVVNKEVDASGTAAYDGTDYLLTL